MVKKKIFIGSSQESREIAKTIAQTLAEHGSVALRWWNEFPAGSITIDRLIEISQNVDGAVFIFSSDDKIWYRGDEFKSPRDNVILEYGLFLNKLGRSRVIILKDAESKLPSDVSSITYLKLIDDSVSVSEKVVDHFNNIFQDYMLPSFDAVPVVADPMLVDKQISKELPYMWHNRDLYLGIEGAKAWINLSNEPQYLLNSATEGEIRKLLLKAIENLSVRTFVSLGPGDAKNDIELASALRHTERWVQYIPVDLSDGLLHSAMISLSNQVRVPIGILADFEDRMIFVQKQIIKYGSSPILYSLLGNTLGDLDHFEGRFINEIRNIINHGDYFLISVSIKGKEWAWETDIRCCPNNYSEEYKRFISLGISRRTLESVSSIVSGFDTRIKIEKGHSDIPNTATFSIIDTKTKRWVCTIRRYEWKSILNWMRDSMGFDILFSEETYFEGGNTGFGVILMKLKK